MGVAHVWVMMGGGLLSMEGSDTRACLLSSRGTRIDGGRPFIFNSAKQKMDNFSRLALFPYAYAIYWFDWVNFKNMPVVSIQSLRNSALVGDFTYMCPC